MSVQNVLNTIKEKNIEWVDFRFTDLSGCSHHISLPAYRSRRGTFVNGVAFDGSSIPGSVESKNPTWSCCRIPDTAYVDPFTAHPTLIIMCDIITPDGEAL